MVAMWKMVFLMLKGIVCSRSEWTVFFYGSGEWYLRENEMLILRTEIPMVRACV